jgi:hypothetical protein
MCIPEGDLRARLDGELSPAESQAIESHLAQCERCRRRAAEIAAQAAEVATLFTEADQAPVDAAAAWTRFRARRDAEAPPARSRYFSRRWMPAWGAAVALALAAVLVSSGPTRALAQRLLGLLRVKTVVAVPLNRPFITEGKAKMLSDILADSVTVTRDEKAQPVADREQASRLAGFTLRLPALRQDAPQLTVEGERSLYFTANPKRLETLLNALGRPDLTVPAGLENAKISVSVARGVKAVYGDCPKREPGPPPSPDAWASCVVVNEAPVPVVVTLPELDLTAVAELGLQLAGMTPEEARSFSRTVDWTSTLAIPLPRDATSYRTVSIEGVQGVLVSCFKSGERPPGYALIWIKDGFVYAVSGFGDSGLAIPLAESMG